MTMSSKGSPHHAGKFATDENPAHADRRNNSEMEISPPCFGAGSSPLRCNSIPSRVSAGSRKSNLVFMSETDSWLPSSGLQMSHNGSLIFSSTEIPPTSTPVQPVSSATLRTIHSRRACRKYQSLAGKAARWSAECDQWAGPVPFGTARLLAVFATVSLAFNRSCRFR